MSELRVILNERAFQIIEQSAKKMDNREVLGILISEESNPLKIVDVLFPAQTVSRGSVELALPPIKFLLDANKIPVSRWVGTFHSHHSMGAFFSGTDDKDLISHQLNAHYFGKDYSINIVWSDKGMKARLDVIHKGFGLESTMDLPITIESNVNILERAQKLLTEKGREAFKFNSGKAIIEIEMTPDFDENLEKWVYGELEKQVTNYKEQTKSIVIGHYEGGGFQQLGGFRQKKKEITSIPKEIILTKIEELGYKHVCKDARHKEVVVIDNITIKDDYTYECPVCHTEWKIGDGLLREAHIAALKDDLDNIGPKEPNNKQEELASWYGM